MHMKIYMFTKDQKVIEIDAPTKAEAWKKAKQIFDEMKTVNPGVAG